MLVPPPIVTGLRIAAKWNEQKTGYPIIIIIFAVEGRGKYNKLSTWFAAQPTSTPRGFPFA